MKRIVLPLLSLLLLGSFARASVNLGIDAGLLANKNGVNIPVGSLVLLIASQGDNLFGAPAAGSYVTGDDIIVGSFAMNYIVEPGEMQTSVNYSYTTSGSASSSTFDVGDLLAIRWYPSITFTQFQGGTKPATGDFYGTYSGIGANPDSGIAWTAPVDGFTYLPGSALNFYTSNTGGGGTQTPATGYATTAVAAVPEPSTFALFGLGAGFAGWMARRKKA